MLKRSNGFCFALKHLDGVLLEGKVTRNGFNRYCAAKSPVVC